MASKRWQDWVNLILGAWLFISPWALGYGLTPPHAAWNAFILGAAIFVFAIIALNVPQVWAEWVNLVLGLWVIISPWVLAFTSQRNATENAVIVGIIVALLALWTLLERRGAGKSGHRSPA